MWRVVVVEGNFWKLNAHCRALVSVPPSVARGGEDILFFIPRIHNSETRVMPLVRCWARPRRERPERGELLHASCQPRRPRQLVKAGEGESREGPSHHHHHLLASHLSNERTANTIRDGDWWISISLSDAFHRLETPPVDTSKEYLRVSTSRFCSGRASQQCR